jgi:hypothetical protein
VAVEAGNRGKQGKKWGAHASASRRRLRSRAMTHGPSQPVTQHGMTDTPLRFPVEPHGVAVCPGGRRRCGQPRGNEGNGACGTLDQGQGALVADETVRVARGNCMAATRQALGCGLCVSGLRRLTFARQLFRRGLHGRLATTASRAFRSCSGASGDGRTVPPCHGSVTLDRLGARSGPQLRQSPLGALSLGRGRRQSRRYSLS